MERRREGKEMNKRPINVLGTIAWLLFGIYSGMIMLDKIDINVTKVIILILIFITAAFSSITYVQRSQ